jgi:uncharacterized protein YjdB
VSVVEGDELKLDTKITFNTGRSEFVTEDIIWSNADPEVAIVDAQGTVTGVSAGLTSITAVSETGLRATIYLLITPIASAPDSP